MLHHLSHSPRTLIPKSILKISQFSSQISQIPRKARQSVHRITNLLSLQSNQIPNLHLSLQTLNSSPQTLTSSQASLLINSVSNPLISFDFYRFLKSIKPGFQFDSRLYFSLIRSQIDSINPKLFKIEFYFTEMKKRGICLVSNDFVCFVDLIIPKFTEISEFFVRDVMDGSNYDKSSYNYLIRVYAKFGFCKEAIFVAEKFREKFSRDCTLEFYASIMSVYKVSGDAGEAMKLFMEMEDRGIVGDEDFYRVLLGVLCKGESGNVCKVVLEEMRRIGYGVDECLAVELMEMFVREDMLVEAGYLIEEGSIKDAKSLSNFMELIVEKKGPLEVLEIVNNMQESGLNVGGQVFASLIYEFGKIGLIEDAEKMFTKVKAIEGVQNRKEVYSSMVLVYSKREMRTMAEMVFYEMEAQMGFEGSEKVFSYMISMYGVLGLFDDVENMFNRWKRSATGINVDVYIAMINALSMWGKLDRARGFLLEMRNCGVQPNSSIYSSMLGGYLRLGLVNHASALYDEYKLLRLELDDLNPITVLSVLIEASRFTELGVYLDKLMRDGVSISRNQGLPLLEMCMNASCLEKLGKLLQETPGRGGKFDRADHCI